MRRKLLMALVFCISIAFLVSTVSAATPPYPAGSAGQSASGSATVYTTSLTPSLGRSNMYGVVSAGSLQLYGSASSWSEYYIDYNPVQSKSATASATIRLSGNVHIACQYYAYGYCSADVAVYCYLKVYDLSSGGQLVAQTQQTILSQSLVGVIPFYPYSYDYTFNPNIDVYSPNVVFNAIVNHNYAIAVRISCQVNANAGGGAIAAGDYDFWSSGYYTQTDYIGVV